MDSRSKSILIFLMVVDLIVAISSPMILSWCSISIELKDSIILGILLFIALSCIELLYHTILQKQKQQEEIIWGNRNREIDKKLYDIKNDILTIHEKAKYNEDDLFYYYSNIKIKNLKKLAHDAVTNEEMTIDGAMIESTEKMYNSAFLGKSNDIFRPVFLCSKEKSFFFSSNLVKKYFEWAFEKVQNNKIIEIRRLLVYNVTTPETDTEIQRLIIFHQQTKGYKCKKIHIDVYRRIRDDNGLLAQPIDGSIGIYGTKYLYTGIEEEKDKIAGLYSKEEKKINSYITFFDQCWDRADDISSLPTPSGVVIDIKYVFGF